MSDDRGIHSFSICGTQPSGARMVEILRRVDLRQLQTIAYLQIFDKDARLETIAERFCAELDEELATRSAPKP